MPAAAGAAITSALLAGGARGLTALTSWKTLLGAGYAGSLVLGQADKSGERGLTREQMAIQKIMMDAQKKAESIQLKESRTNTRDMMKQIKDLRNEERTQGRDDMLLQAMLGQQEQKMQRMMGNVSDLSQISAGTRPPYRGSQSFLGLLRS